MSRRYVSENPRVYHSTIGRNEDRTACGKPTMIFHSVGMGQKGWDKPQCLKCEAVALRAKQPGSGT